jgi:hypothetical protein
VVCALVVGRWPPWRTAAPGRARVRFDTSLNLLSMK